MIASITRVESGINVLTIQILICYCRSQISELRHILKVSITYIYVVILPWILVKRRQHILRFLCVSLSKLK
jgi:hypothetical protein